MLQYRSEKKKRRLIWYEIKIRFLGSHKEFPCMSLSQAKFNDPEITYGFLSTNRQTGNVFLFGGGVQKNPTTQKREVLV